MRNGRSLLERIYARLLVDFAYPDEINWLARQTVTRLMRRR